MARRTDQRKAIRQALERAERPLSVPEILDAAQGEVPGIGVATVYRNVKMLVDEGWLIAVELPGAPSRYELAGQGHHHHFHCTDCGRVFDVDQCGGDPEAGLPSGFRVERHEVLLYGHCDDCPADAGSV
jgi:Fur family ferric uptake transcriptional regulator